MHFGATDRRRLERAFALALEWHGDQHRKGSRTPYVSHLLQVSGLVLEHGGDADQAAAAFLHDSLEDAPSAVERRRREARIVRSLGAGVLRIVRDCTDTGPEESFGSKRPWKERKQGYLAHLRRASRRSLLVAACDKRHNLGALVADLRTHGRGYLEHFNAGPTDQLWFVAGVLAAMRGRVPGRLERELAELHRELRTLLGSRARRARAGRD